MVCAMPLAGLPLRPSYISAGLLVCVWPINHGAEKTRFAEQHRVICPPTGVGISDSTSGKGNGTTEEDAVRLPTTASFKYQGLIQAFGKCYRRLS